MSIPTNPDLNEQWTNEVTGVTYIWNGDRWVILADPVPVHDLEYVLTQGNVADKGMLLTDAEDALIALAPDEATLDIASDTEKKNPRLRLTHIDQLNYPNAQAQIELDQDGTRVDFEFFQSIDECHFRFDNEEKFVLNRDGDAQFIGKVEGEPGTQDNEFVTYGQLTTLEEEIEQLAPSLERGSWVYTSNYPPGEGEYTLVKEILDEDEQEALCQAIQLECITAANGDVEAINACNRDLIACQNAIVGTKVVTTAEFGEATRIYFNDVDANGTTHAWAEIPPDHFIDVFNEADDGFLVGDITEHTGGNFSIELLSSKGTANGIATVKIFRTQGTVDFDSYVRKSGDTMTGALTIQGDSVSRIYGKSGALAAYGGPDASAGSYIFYIYGGPYPKPDGEPGETKKDLIFGVTNDGRVYGKSGYKPTSADQFSTKRYVDEVIKREVAAPARYEYKCYINQTGANGPGGGQAFFSKEDMTSSTIKLSLTARNAIVPIQGHSGVTMFTYNSSINNTYRSMTISCWYHRSSSGTEDWKWKGTAEIDSIKLYSDYIEVTTSSNSTRKWANGNIGDGLNYRFTISGLL